MSRHVNINDLTSRVHDYCNITFTFDQIVQANKRNEFY